MSYKYYSIMRPIGIGTLPKDKRPVRINNYPEGKKDVRTADGRTICAWGEVEYSEPLSSMEMYDSELKGDTEFPVFKKVGYWKNDKNEPEIVALDGRFFALNGYESDKYVHCWECQSPSRRKGESEYTLKPVYRYASTAGQIEMESMLDMLDNDEKWNRMYDRMHEIISYEVTEN